MGGEKVVMSRSGATSSKVPRYDLIPIEALIRVAERYELGLAKHGKDNWRKGLGDKAYLINRATHVIDHALKLIAKLEGYIRDDGDDDIGAILWGGCFLAVAIDHLDEDREETGLAEKEAEKVLTSV
jgi:hypothetical protein